MSGFVLEVENDKMKMFKNVYCLALGLSFSEEDKVKMISILDNLYQHDNSGETEETGPTGSVKVKLGKRINTTPVSMLEQRASPHTQSRLNQDPGQFQPVQK